MQLNLYGEYYEKRKFHSGEKMRYGYCTGFSTKPHFRLGRDLLPMIHRTGFDYVEFPLMNFHAMNDSEITSLCDYLEANDLESPIACNFFPPSIKLVGQSLNVPQLREYLGGVLPRCARLGIKKLILGSGPSRNFPAEMTREEAFDQFSNVISSEILPAVKKYTMHICIEPFERQSCNLIVSIIEGQELVERLNDPNFSLMIDIYHMLCNREDLSDIETCFKYISHVHVAGMDRCLPSKEESYVHEALSILATLGYEGSVSLETELPASEVVLEEYLTQLKGVFSIREKEEKNEG